MKISSKTGSMLTLLIFLLVLGAAYLYFKSSSQEQATIEKRGFLTYEEHQRKQDRERVIQESKDKIQAFFAQFKK